MKINGSFILRNIVGDYVLVPVGDTAVQFNGMVILNDVGAIIWQGVRDGKTEPEILAQIVEEYEVTEDQARADYKEFVENMLKSGLMAEA